MRATDLIRLVEFNKYGGKRKSSTPREPIKHDVEMTLDYEELNKMLELNWSCEINWEKKETLVPLFTSRLDEPTIDEISKGKAFGVPLKFTRQFEDANILFPLAVKDAYVQAAKEIKSDDLHQERVRAIREMLSIMPTVPNAPSHQVEFDYKFNGETIKPSGDIGIRVNEFRETEVAFTMFNAEHTINIMSENIPYPFTMLNPWEESSEAFLRASFLSLYPMYMEDNLRDRIIDVTLPRNYRPNLSDSRGQAVFKSWLITMFTTWSYDWEYLSACINDAIKNDVMSKEDAIELTGMVTGVHKDTLEKKLDLNTP